MQRRDVIALGASVEFFGASHGSVDHQGVHCVVIDNVSEPGARSATRSSPGCRPTLRP